MKSNKPLISLLIFEKHEIKKQPKTVLFSWKKSIKRICGRDIKKLFSINELNRDNVIKDIYKFKKSIIERKTQNYEWGKINGTRIINRTDKKLDIKKMKSYLKQSVKFIHMNSGYFINSKPPVNINKKNVLKFLDEIEKKLKFNL